MKWLWVSYIYMTSCTNESKLRMKGKVKDKDQRDGHGMAGQR